MIPNKFIYKVLFVFLFNFTNRGKIMFIIFLIYLFLILFNHIKDGSIILIFISFYCFLFMQGFFMQNSFKKSFTRYKKYLRLKRKRLNKNKNTGV